MNHRKFIFSFVFFDIFSICLAWILFCVIYGLKFSHVLPGNQTSLELDKLIFPWIFLLSAFWTVLFSLFGYYRNTIRKYRMEVAGNTVSQIFVGSLILLLGFLFIEHGQNTPGLLKLLFYYIFIQYVVTSIIRLFLTSVFVYLKRKDILYFKSLIVGRSGMITPILDELRINYAQYGNRMTGYVLVDDPLPENMSPSIPLIGKMNQLSTIVQENKIEDVIIVLKADDLEIYRKIMEQLYGTNVFIKINTELYPIFLGRTDVSALFYYPLINIPRDSMSSWQMINKRLVDIIVSLSALIISSPVSILLVFLIKMGTRGPAIYSHERIGKNGRPFRILKFRSMIVDAEQNGPQLSSRNDKRITKIGFFMRRLRLDEIPNFFNVLMGDMSLVGPRPERKYFIDLIIEKAPEFKKLLQVKPGVTSWGQVRYGYAENVEEMIRRMHYDMLYLDNMSLFVDFQILIRTIFTILQGRGI